MAEIEVFARNRYTLLDGTKLIWLQGVMGAGKSTLILGKWLAEMAAREDVFMRLERQYLGLDIEQVESLLHDPLEEQRCLYSTVSSFCDLDSIVRLSGLAEEIASARPNWRAKVTECIGHLFSPDPHEQDRLIDALRLEIASRWRGLMIPNLPVFGLQSSGLPLPRLFSIVRETPFP